MLIVYAYHDCWSTELLRICEKYSYLIIGKKVFSPVAIIKDSRLRYYCQGLYCFYSVEKVVLSKSISVLLSSLGTSVYHTNNSPVG